MVEPLEHAVAMVEPLEHAVAMVEPLEHAVAMERQCMTFYCKANIPNVFLFFYRDEYLLPHQNKIANYLFNP